jgi:hypothetical protein
MPKRTTQHAAPQRSLFARPDRSDSARGDEAGAILILALVFLLLTGGIIGSLLSWSQNDLLNTKNFNAASSLGYSAGGAVDVAMQSARYSSPDSLTMALTAGQQGVTSLSVTPLTAPVNSGDQVTIGSGAAVQTVTATTSAAINVTTISVVSFNSTAAEPVNTVIFDDTCAGTSPTVVIAGNSIAVWCSLVWTPLSATTRVETFAACASSVSAANCMANPYVQAVVTFDDYSYPIGVATPWACTATCGTGMIVNSWVTR